VKIHLVRGLPFVKASLTQNGSAIELDQVLLDTGSERSVFSADELQRLKIFVEKEDLLHRVRGVGGVEFVFSRRLEKVAVGEMELRDFEVQIGAMEYGFRSKVFSGWISYSKFGR
jgi:aspartyl protease